MIEFDVTMQEYKIIKDILNYYLKDCNVYVFGSRAKNTTRFNSDIDLAIESKMRIDQNILIDLKESFSNSDLPYSVDIVDLNHISESFKELINQEKKVFPLKENNSIRA